ncbi:MAG: HipA N-terminal domain-containing protein [Fibrobacter sp.]|nr:HipA N-terminal domain-containing protein [Fibrobacter sp.]
MNNFGSASRRARVFYNDILAGYLIQYKGRYAFLYDADYAASKNPSIALDMPKRKRLFRAPYLFPYFQGLLPEGANKSFYCSRLGVLQSDKFALLLKLSGHETIGAVTVRGMV